MEDQEPGEEREAVGGQVEALDERIVRGTMQAKRRSFPVPEVTRLGQHDADNERDGQERQRLPQYPRLALALPGPAADTVADRRPGEPARGTRCPSGHGQHAEADEVSELGCDQRESRGGGESQQPPDTW